MGGDVKVESEEGKGSSFQFTLDLKAWEQPTIIAKEERKKEDVALPDLRILVVEGHPVNQLILNRMLTTEGCNVKVANNGQEAVELAAGNKFDVILMDGEMPVMDGLEATRLIRIRDPDTPIIGITAHAMATDRERFLAAGMNGYLTKPCRKNVLIEAILRCIGKFDDSPPHTAETRE